MSDWMWLVTREDAATDKQIEEAYLMHPNSAVHDILDEIHKQDEKWGAGRSHPWGGRILRAWGWMSEGIARLMFRLGYVSWAAILLEEVGEALRETNPSKLEYELTQVGAVAAQAATSIRRQRITQAREMSCSESSQQR